LGNERQTVSEREREREREREKTLTWIKRHHLSDK